MTSKDSRSNRSWRKGRALVVLLGVACGSNAGVIKTGPHIPDKEARPVEVDEPPPATKVEAVPLRRNKNCDYRDGAWKPAGRGWEWEEGEWILSPKGCYYAPPTIRYEDLKSGPALVYREGTWHPLGSGTGQCASPRPCPIPTHDDIPGHRHIDLSSD
jgi:hypothetical protein